MSHQRSSTSHRPTEDDQVSMLQGSDEECASSLDLTCEPEDEDEDDNSDTQIDSAKGYEEGQIVRRSSKRTSWVMNMYNAWVTNINSRVGDEECSREKYSRINKPLHEMADEELNHWLSKFVCEARMHDGQEYKSKTLSSIRLGLQSHLKEKTKRQVYLLKDPKYAAFRRSYQAEVRRLGRKKGSGQKTKTKRFTPMDEEVLWRHRILGSHQPQVLQQTMVFLNIKNFGLKGGDDHRSLKRSAVSLVTINGMEYLRYRRAGCTPRTNSKDTPPEELFVPSNLEMPERCHVRLCKLYFARRPECREGRDYFYASLARVTPKVASDPWYIPLPVGHNTFTKMIADMFEKAKSLRYELVPVQDEVPPADVDIGPCSPTPWEGNAEPITSAWVEITDPVVKMERIEMNHDVINGMASFADAAEACNLTPKEAESFVFPPEAAESFNLPPEAASSSSTDLGVQCNLMQPRDSAAAAVYYITNCNVTINNNQAHFPEKPTRRETGCWPFV